jgi:cytochrome c5
VKHRFQYSISLVVLAAVLCLVDNAWMAKAEPPPKKSVDAPRTSEKKVQKKPEKKPEKKFGGAELFAMHCNRCHAERYATERTEEQWNTILLHMRVRANVPAAQARTILKFLQEDSGK